MKVGDIVTQSDEFYNHWNCDVFHVKINHIKLTKGGNIIFLETPVTITSVGNFMWPTECSDFHEKFLKLDIIEMRKQKLEKLKTL